MKLQLKHLASYLPYGLQYARITDSAVTLKKEVKIMGELSTKGNIHNIHNNVLGDYTNFQYKPILRPLSDLTKEIQVNGKKFVPVEWLKEKFIGETIGLNLSTWSHRSVQKLIEWHFDIYSLIPQGLAIDINTLES